MSTTAQAKQAADPSGVAEPAKGAGAPEESGSSFRLDSLGAGTLEGLVEKPKKRVPLHLILFAGLIVAAGGSLYVMRMMGLGPTGAVADIKIEYEAKGPVMGKDHERILNDLTASHIEQQVPVEEVRRNPFEIPNSLSGVAPTGPVGPDNEALRLKREKEEQDRLQREADEHKAMIATTLSSLKIHSILGGSMPIARINDQTVRVGDTVAGMFKVTAIQGRSVELTADGESHTISMDEPEDGTRPPSAPAPSRPAPRQPTLPPPHVGGGVGTKKK